MTLRTRTDIHSPWIFPNFRVHQICGELSSKGNYAVSEIGLCCIGIVVWSILDEMVKMFTCICKLLIYISICNGSRAIGTDKMCDEDRLTLGMGKFRRKHTDSMNSKLFPKKGSCLEWGMLRIDSSELIKPNP